MGGFEHGQQFFQLVRAPISAPYSVETTILRGGRREEKESDSDP